ncbi:hypothetical protein llap_9617 [Limosa lapponica baueri]|uniref:Uncharacterized protein n=1 Tax=Limosa lapponica baueri TaxID=1758121 RepID=A0A2I0U1Y2_LIMLA|nr:hypothetical protein llap_9617 [Limosa lapponica baueri]
MESEKKAEPGSYAFSHFDMALNSNKNKVAARQVLPSQPWCQTERLGRKTYANSNMLKEAKLVLYLNIKFLVSPKANVVRNKHKKKKRKKQ